MSTIINCSIDVKAITKGKIKIHANGKHYWNFSVMERKEPDEYGNTHYIVESQTKQEREGGEPKNYLASSGKAHVFGNSNGQQQVASNDVSNASDEDDDLPF